MKHTNLLPYIKIGKEILMFCNIEIEKIITLLTSNQKVLCWLLV